MNTTPNVLGKGLSSLIPGLNQSASNSWGATVPVSSGESITAVSPDAIVSNPWQPRKQFDEEKLEELSKSIKEHGIIQPLIVTKTGNNAYQLIAGERRLKAARMIGLSQVPVVVRKAQDQNKLELSLIENLQRHDLNPLEEALSYRRLMDEFSLTQEEVAERVGRSRSSVANILRLLTLPQEALVAIEQGKITFSHAKVILSYETPGERLKALDMILKQGLTVAEISKPPKNRSVRRGQLFDPVIASWEEKLAKHLGFDARIKKNARGGLVEFIYNSEEDLKTLLDKLLKT